LGCGWRDAGEKGQQGKSHGHGEAGAHSPSAEGVQALVLLQNQAAKFKHYKDIEEPKQGRGDRPEFLIQTGIHVQHEKTDTIGDPRNKVNEEKPISAI
jgi:hypothetical protein